MGEVYLAEDSRLDRKVALKILPQHLSERAELRERFEREARAVSSLNHPHICTLHDIGEQDGIHYLVWVGRRPGRVWTSTATLWCYNEYLLTD